MKALGSEDMVLDQIEDRLQGEGSMADLVGQRRQRQIDPLDLEARALAVERNMHAELVEQDRRQQLRTDEATRRGMERRRRLTDLTAIAAGELFAHLLDQLEPTRGLLQRFGHVLAQLRQPRAAAAGASSGRIDDDPLALVSGTITAGTKPPADSPPRRPSRHARRQRCSNWFEMPCRRAVDEPRRGPE